MPRSELRAVPPPIEPMSRRARTILWVVTLLGLAGAGAAFAFKLAEFIFTLGSDELTGFADVPVAVYFLVAAGWLAILLWCFMTGRFRDLEQPKFDMLAREEEYERRGE